MSRTTATASLSTRPPDDMAVGPTPGAAPAELFGVVVSRGGRWPTETVGWFTTYSAGQEWALAEPLDHDEFVVVPFRVVGTLLPAPAP